jgi:hypothetical protein
LEGIFLWQNARTRLWNFRDGWVLPEKRRPAADPSAPRAVRFKAEKPFPVPVQGLITRRDWFIQDLSGRGPRF